MNKKGLYTQSLRSYSSWIMFGKEYWPIFTFTVTQQVIFVFARTANLCSLLPSYRVKKRRIYGEPAVPFFFSCSSYSPEVTTPDRHISSEHSSRRNVLVNLQLLHHWWYTGIIFTFKVRLLHLCSFNSSPGPGACAAW